MTEQTSNKSKGNDFSSVRLHEITISLQRWLVDVTMSILIFRYLRSVSILTFMNKIDILKEKIERGANFAEALEKIKAEALFNASNQSTHSDHDRQIYRKLYEILCEHPYEEFSVTGTYK